MNYSALSFLRVRIIQFVDYLWMTLSLIYQKIIKLCIINMYT
jgi:hypothetical protein